MLGPIKAGHSCDFGWRNSIIRRDFSISIPVLLRTNWRERGLGEEGSWSSVVDVSQVRLSQQEASVFLTPFFFYPCFLAPRPPRKLCILIKPGNSRAEWASSQLFGPPLGFRTRTRHLSLSCDPQHLAFSLQGAWHRFIRLPPYQFISYYLPLRSTRCSIRTAAEGQQRHWDVRYIILH